MRRRRPLRPVGRRMIRKQFRREMRRYRRRRILRRTRRFVIGSAIIFAIADSVNNYKLWENDVARIEEQYSKPVEELTEEELIQAMKRLGIQKLELTEEEEDKVVEEMGEAD